MTVCRYFRNGYCRNGDACRFEHSYYNQRPPLLNTPVYHSAYSTGYGQRGQSGSPGGDWRNEEQQQQQSMVDQIMTDIDLMLRGKQYLFSCVPGRQPHSNCKNLSDLSPEEIRVKFLECMAMNNNERFLSEMSAHRIHVEGILRQLSKNPSMLDDAQPAPAGSVIPHLQHSGTSFAGNPSFHPSQGTPSSAVLGVSPSAFSANSGSQSTPTFGSAPPLGSVQQPAAQTTAMGVPQDSGQPRALFGKSVQSSGSLFDASRSMQPATIFQQGPHIAPTGYPTITPVPQVAQAMPSQSGFAMHQAPQVPQHVPSPPVPSFFSVTGPAPQNTLPSPHQTSQADDVYSCLMDMSPEDLSAYQDRAFTIAGVPLVPPAKEHCF